MHRLLALCLLLAASLQPALARAQVVVFPVERANITPEEGDAISAVMADAYAEVTSESVTLAPASGNAEATRAPAPTPAPAPGAPEAPPTATPSAPAGPAETARALGAKEYITLRATRLDQNIILSATRYSAANGEELYRVRMTAASFDDVETVATRMARALYDRKHPTESRTIDTVTKREGQAKNRTFSEKVMGLKTTFTTIFSSVDYEPMVSFGFDGRLEGQNYFLEWGVGFVVPTGGGDPIANDSVGGLYSEFGGSYYLMNTSVSPYVGAGVMPRLMFGDISGGANIAVYGQGGFMFFRESSTRLYADVRVAQNLTAWTTQTYNFTGTPTTTERSSYPTELIIQVGIGW